MFSILTVKRNLKNTIELLIVTYILQYNMQHRNLTRASETEPHYAKSRTASVIEIFLYKYIHDTP